MSNLADTGVGANSLSFTAVVLIYDAGAYLAAYIKALMAQSHANFA
ncbi:hypothetical protein OAS67_02770 [Alphaproteobacteria bacterium]|jgi:hypothetical protein|nr:hypothetical protein [Alphaproteobacteria bacterium]